MSAVLIIRQRYSAHMVTDGALIGPDLRFSGFLSKTMALPHLNAAVTMRGTEIDMLCQLPLCGTAPDIATMRARSEDAVRQLAKLGRGMEVHVASLEACFAVTKDGTVEIEAFGMAPQCTAVREMLAGKAPDDLDPAVVGLHALKLMRDTAACAGIGGFVQCTSIFPDRIVTKILHKWPDLVGDWGAGRRGYVGVPEGLFA